MLPHDTMPVEVQLDCSWMLRWKMVAVPERERKSWTAKAATKPCRVHWGPKNRARITRKRLEDAVAKRLPEQTRPQQIRMVPSPESHQCRCDCKVPSSAKQQLKWRLDYGSSSSC